MAQLEHRHLRSALEFAVLIAVESQKRKPAMEYPPELKPYFNKARLPSGALGRLRRVIEADARFRRRIAVGAVPELVDEIGRLWLDHAEGWESQALALASRIEAESESTETKAQIKRAERRREAAELVAVRTRAELLQRDDVIAVHRTEIDDLRADVAKAEESLVEMRSELIDVRMEVRHARDRETAAINRATSADEQLAVLREQLDGAGSDLADAPVPQIDNTAEISAAATAARSLAEQLDALLPAVADGQARVDTSGRPVRRAPVALPGGVIASSAEAAEFLARSDAQWLIDGYNVAKLGWPNRPLEHQRAALLDAVENLSRRFGTDVTVVFDGASVIGAHAARRRLARVVYSPEGTIADDVIRDEVRRLPTSRGVIVVTNDAEIVRDVRAAGANVVPSNSLLAIL